MTEDNFATVYETVYETMVEAGVGIKVDDEVAYEGGRSTYEASVCSICG